MGFVGIIIVFVMVFGGFMLAGGHLSIILRAAPLELMIIGSPAAIKPLKLKSNCRMGFMPIQISSEFWASTHPTSLLDLLA